MGDVQPADFRIIVAPAVGFGEIGQALASVGLLPGPDDAVTPPAIPGEREFAHWTAPEDDARVHYSFNPVVFLRVLVFSGRSAIRWQAAVSDKLAQLEPQEIGALLQSSSPREVLLGLYAAAELKAIGLLADIEPLRIHTDRRISQTAGQVAEKLALAFVSIGAERLAEAQRWQPDRSALFPRLGDAGVRRDTLIWLMRDGHGASPDSIKVLRSGLSDPDWQVRVTAMFVAARLKVAVLWQEIRQMELPSTSRSGLDDRARSLLKATRKAVLADLAGEPLPGEDNDDARLMRQLRGALAGKAVDGRDDLRDWVENWLLQR
ncbi:hypothetical protein ACN2CC_26495 [Mesorhizobium muleiense]|uniref:hypothetical protein n=1 Tax=Mesorhizobium muleiense TaxID=1004279 RepID=UPI003AFA86DA